MNISLFGNKKNLEGYSEVFFLFFFWDRYQNKGMFLDFWTPDQNSQSEKLVIVFLLKWVPSFLNGRTHFPNGVPSFPKWVPTLFPEWGTNQVFVRLPFCWRKGYLDFPNVVSQMKYSVSQMENPYAYLSCMHTLLILGILAAWLSSPGSLIIIFCAVNIVAYKWCFWGPKSSMPRRSQAIISQRILRGYACMEYPVFWKGQQNF